MFSLVVSNLAQTQKGFIRTICRPDRASKPVAEVTILVSEGNKSVLSNTKGEFSFPCRSECYFQALSISENSFGTMHPDVASIYNNIGIVYYKQSDYSKALDYLSKALAIYENILGPDHSKLQTVKDNIEDVKRKLAEAEEN
jgi:tetratricopeptide (TPR) repeat protein